VRFLPPLGGVSAIDAPSMPFHDPAVNSALFDAIRSGWKRATNRKLIEVAANINDPKFAAQAAAQLRSIIN